MLVVLNKRTLSPLVSAVTRPITVVILGTTISLAVSFAFVELFGEITAERVPAWQLGITVILWFLSLSIPAAIIVFAIAVSFSHGSFRELLATILVCYVCITIVFAGLYYSISAWADFNDAVDKYYWYRGEYSGAKASQLFEPRRLARDVRAFNGIEARFWSGVDWRDLSWPSERSASALTVQEMMELSQKEVDDVIKFQGSAREEVFFSSLHFSVVTVTTLGSGDITPNRWYTKLASDAEVIIGLVLPVLALGLLLSRRPSPPRPQ